MILHGDSIEKLKTLPESSVDAVVTDPPYGLSFMGKKWDYDVPSVELWREVFRVLKPGGHVLSFGGTRTYHRMVVNVEDAGFEIRDQIQWLYGSGFPKSHDVSKGIDKAAWTTWLENNPNAKKHLREIVETGSDLKRAYEKHADQVRVYQIEAGVLRETIGENPNTSGRVSKIDGGSDYGGFTRVENAGITAPSTAAAKQWQGWGTALKPANEPIVLARKPLIGTVAENVQTFGTGALNIEASRIGTEQVESGRGGRKATDSVYQDGLAPQEERSFVTGRWPANVLFDEWDEPVLSLQDSIPLAAKVAIEEFYAGYCKLSDMQGKDCHVSESQKSNEVLQSRVFCEGADVATGADAREKTQQKDNGHDRKNKKEEPSELLGKEQCPMERRMALSWLSLHQGGEASAETANHSRQDDNAGARVGRASPSDGAKTKASAQGKRSRSPQERRQTRQSCEQSRASRHEPSQERTLASFEGSPSSPLFVRESDVPRVWSRYFKDSGFTVRAGSAAVLDAQAEAVSRFFYVAKASKRERNAGLEGMAWVNAPKFDGGGFQSASTSAKERYMQNFHPTVKPIKLMEYLIKLITPPGGVVLDPFMGSGTTGVACKNLGFNFIGIEREKAYAEIAEKRIEHAECSA